MRYCLSVLLNVPPAIGGLRKGGLEELYGLRIEITFGWGKLSIYLLIVYGLRELR